MAAIGCGYKEVPTFYPVFRVTGEDGKANFYTLDSAITPLISERLKTYPIGESIANIVGLAIRYYNAKTPTKITSADFEKVRALIYQDDHFEIKFQGEVIYDSSKITDVALKAIEVTVRELKNVWIEPTVIFESNDTPSFDKDVHNIDLRLALPTSLTPTSAVSAPKEKPGTSGALLEADPMPEIDSWFKDNAAILGPIREKLVNTKTDFFNAKESEYIDKLRALLKKQEDPNVSIAILKILCDQYNVAHKDKITDEQKAELVKIFVISQCKVAG
jgi:hypothetical protein